MSMSVSMYPRRSGDRFTWVMFLSDMLCYAYNVPAAGLVGYKEDHHLYSVVAKIEPAATEDEARAMLQGLLVERLKLVAHRETREVQGYALVLAKNGPKLKAANPSDPLPPTPDSMNGAPATSYQGRTLSIFPGKGVLSLVGRGVSMRQLADELSKDLRTPVVDRTELTGKYFFELKSQMPNPQVSANSDDLAQAADIFSALPDELGLKLEKQKVSAEFLAVEHSEKPAEDQQ